LSSVSENIEYSKLCVLGSFTSTIIDCPKHQRLAVKNGKVRKPDSLFMEAVK
jgi:hypothetical protein